MSTETKAKPAPSTPGAGQSTMRTWKDYSPKSVDDENAMNHNRVAAVWQKLYNEAGASDEEAYRSVRAGVYLYGLKNGTSREGSYGGEIALSNGTVLKASAIPIATGRMDVRKFYRGNTNESYHALKSMDLDALAPTVIAKAAGLGISGSECVALADWMADNPLFTPSEINAHVRSFNYAIARARVGRGGTLESIEDKRLETSIKAQGESESEGRINF